MEVKLWTYEEFPEFSRDIDGVQVLETTGEELGIRYVHNVEYANINGTPLHLQLLIPFTRNDEPPRFLPPTKFFPCVAFVQGSGWFPQDVYWQIPLLAGLARKDYVIAIIEYRPSAIAYFPAQIMDAKNAIRFLKVHAKEYGIDAKRIVAAGNSSGGHTAVFSGILGEETAPESNLFPGVSADTIGIIDFYGSTSVIAPDSNPSQIKHCQADSPEGLVMGHVDLNEKPELKETLSAECWITPESKLPPLLIFHGTKDRVVNTECSVRLYEKCRECGKDVTFYLIKGGDHGGAEFWTDQVLDIIDKFIKRC